MQRTTTNLIRILEADGWYLHRSAKHKIYRHPDRQTVSGRPLTTLHGKKEMKLTTWNSILKDASISPERAEELLNKK